MDRDIGEFLRAHTRARCNPQVPRPRPNFFLREKSAGDAEALSTVQLGGRLRGAGANLSSTSSDKFAL